QVRGRLDFNILVLLKGVIGFAHLVFLLNVIGVSPLYFTTFSQKNNRDIRPFSRCCILFLFKV
ncbi:MAG: hypothetical protein LBN39_01675, partial [Planctomycetaceae bacterium]|nr:hypothetical protein [Planctomycetaceae bacterium]